MNKSGLEIRVLSFGMLLTCVFGYEHSTRVTTVSPEKQMPGMIVRVTTDKAVFHSDQMARIEMDDQVAEIVQVISETQADIFVPNLPPRQVKVRVREPGKSPGPAGQLTILPAPSLQLTLLFKNDTVSVIRAQPRAGEITPAAEIKQERLSFDVLNAQGGLVYTGSVVHPKLYRVEVYDERQTAERFMHLIPAPQQVVYAIKIPNVLSYADTIKFFDVEAGIDLTKPEGRGARKSLNAIKLNQ